MEFDCASVVTANARIKKTSREIRRSEIAWLTGAPGFFFDGPTFDEFTADMITEAGFIGNAYSALGRNFDFGLDNVFEPVTFAGRDIARQRVTGKGRDGDVLSAADAGFEHSAAPDGDISCEAVGLDCARIRMAADAAEFDVDDARGAELDSCGGVAHMLDRFIEAERSLQNFLKFGMGIDIVPPKGLFHHE